VALGHILDLLAEHGVHATFFVPGVVAEAYPEHLRSIVMKGHEIALHGYSHKSPAALSPQEEEDELTRARRALRQFDDLILGYRSPAWELSEVTLGLLEKHGLLYSSNLMDDLRPYLHAGRKLVELPVHWALDDAPHFWFDAGSWDRSISAPSRVFEIWKAEFLGILELGGLIVLTLHPQIIGRPHRLSMLDEWLTFVRTHPDVWIAPAREIAQHALETLA
jgi:peptidoglycan/xylan/chitin deacetylase (PgdA/CDA1 family)